MSGKRDKIWLATDSKDQVGAFFPGRAGAIPDAVKKIFKAEELESLLPEPSCDTVFPMLGRLDPDPDRRDRHVPFAHNDKLGRTLLFLNTLDPVLDALAEKKAEALQGRGGKAVLFYSLTKAEAIDIHQLGQCRSCFWPKDWESRDERLPARGLFRYDHLCEDWISGPYGSYQQPIEPLQLGDLSEDLRKHAEEVRFDGLDFLEHPRLQPAEHGPCRCSDFGYLDSQGEVQDPHEGNLA